MQPAHHLNQPTALEKAFHRDMLQIYQRAKEECGYNATRFLQLVANDGGLKTAQKLLATATPSDGFVELWENRRLDLSMENLVLNPKYRSLFSQQEIETAKERLNAYGFTPPRRVRLRPYQPVPKNQVLISNRAPLIKSDQG